MSHLTSMCATDAPAAVGLRCLSVSNRLNLMLCRQIIAWATASFLIGSSRTVISVVANSSASATTMATQRSIRGVTILCHCRQTNSKLHQSSAPTYSKIIDRTSLGTYTFGSAKLSGLDRDGQLVSICAAMSLPRQVATLKMPADYDL